MMHSKNPNTVVSANLPLLAPISRDEYTQLKRRTGNKLESMEMLITLKCVAKRLTGGIRSEHITCLWWEKYEDSMLIGHVGCYSREQMVAYIEENGANSVWCPHTSTTQGRAWVTVHSNGPIKHLQSVIDGSSYECLLRLRNR